MVNSTIQHVKKYHTIANFSLINQNGKTITQEELKNDSELMLLSHSVTPVIDSVVQLKKYVLEKRAIKKTNKSFYQDFSMSFC